MLLFTFSSYRRFSLVGLREHIKKRPPLATSEKVQQYVRVWKIIVYEYEIKFNFFPPPLTSLTFIFIIGFIKARGKEAIVAGFYHEGYEDPLLMLMKRRSVHSGLVVKVCHEISFRTFFLSYIYFIQAFLFWILAL